MFPSVLSNISYISYSSNKWLMCILTKQGKFHGIYELVSFYSRYVASPRPLDIFLKAFPVRLLFGLVSVAIVWWTPLVADAGVFPYYYYVVLVGFFLLHQVMVVDAPTHTHTQITH